jgi:hypothetical protein
MDSTPLVKILSMQPTTTRKSNHLYDYAIIGSGLTGLAIANALSRVTSNLILIESADTFGGLNRSIQTPFGAVNNGLRYLPETELSQKAIAFLEMLLMTSLSPETIEAPPMTYEAGGLRPFVGFGNNPPAFYDEVSFFTQPRSLRTKLEPHEWTQVLFSHFTGEFMPRSYVTKFHQEGNQITHLTVNGQKTVSALNYIYCGPVKSLKTLLPEGALNARAFQKLAKNEYWTAVGLDLLHSHPVTDLKNVHILNGTTQDEIGPCVGTFHAPAEVNGETLQYSQWLTFLADEEAEDTEVVGAALKKIKRQIKRAYPDALENLKFERILVVPSFSGNGDLKLSGNQTLPGLENFWVGSAQMSTQKNLLGALLQAEMVTSALGCHPMGSQIESSETLPPNP